jgi:hypothetical protein
VYNSELLNVRAGGTYNYHCALKTSAKCLTMSVVVLLCTILGYEPGYWPGDVTECRAVAIWTINGFFSLFYYRKSFITKLIALFSTVISHFLLCFSTIIEQRSDNKNCGVVTGAGPNGKAVMNCSYVVQRFCKEIVSCNSTLWRFDRNFVPYMRLFFFLTERSL